MRTSYVLIIEDDDLIARMIERCLRGREFQVNLANSVTAGLQAAHRNVPDLVILDVNMPGMNAFNVCKEIREDPILRDVPILFLTDKIKPEDAIVGLSLGVDDYLRKPFDLDELLLRVFAILRRTKNMKNQSAKVEPIFFRSRDGKTIPVDQLEANHIIQVGEYSLNTRTYIFSSPVRGDLRVTPIQYALLYHLMSHPNKIFSPSLLLEEVWNFPNRAGSSDLVRVHIKNLREAIEDDPKKPTFIKTIKGYGYTIQSGEVDAAPRKTRKAKAK